jgi:hydrogenase expression/formation protein HypE
MDGVEALCAAFDMDPWTASSSGTVLLTAPASESTAILEALAGAGIPAADVGEVTDDGGVRVDGDPHDPPAADPFWPTYERARERYGSPEQRN